MKARKNATPTNIISAVVSVGRRSRAAKNGIKPTAPALGPGSGIDRPQKRYEEVRLLSPSLNPAASTRSADAKHATRSSSDKEHAPEMQRSSLVAAATASDSVVFHASRSVRKGRRGVSDCKIDRCQKLDKSGVVRHTMPPLAPVFGHSLASICDVGLEVRGAGLYEIAARGARSVAAPPAFHLRSLAERTCAINTAPERPSSSCPKASHVSNQTSCWTGRG